MDWAERYSVALQYAKEMADAIREVEENPRYLDDKKFVLPQMRVEYRRRLRYCRSLEMEQDSGRIVTMARTRKKWNAALRVVYGRAIRKLTSGTDPLAVERKMKEQLLGLAEKIAVAERWQDFEPDIEAIQWSQEAARRFMNQVNDGMWDEELADPKQTGAMMREMERCSG